MRVYKVQLEDYNGPWIVHEVESVIDGLRRDLPEMDNGDSITIVVSEMEDEEYKNLPEFLGY